MAKCRICKKLKVTKQPPICPKCRIQGENGNLGWIKRQRFRRLFIDLRNSDYEKQDSSEYAFVREVLVANDVSIPGSTEDHTQRNLIVLIGVIIAALTLLLRVIGVF